MVSGVGGGTGIGLVEVYDLGSSQSSELANIATRGLVLSGDNVMIGGLIITGSNARKVIVRAIGPSLSIDGRLEDPLLLPGILLRGRPQPRRAFLPAAALRLASLILGVFAAAGQILVEIVDADLFRCGHWANGSHRKRERGNAGSEKIEATTIPPSHDLESAIVASLSPAAYTAIVRGMNEATGIALVEVYALE